MSIIIFAIVVLIVVALLIYACDMIPLAPPFANIIKVLVILLGVLFIIQKADLL